MPFIKLTKIERKRVVVLVSCLLCACFAWLILALNNKYVYSVQTQLIYKDEPLKKAFKALQPDVVELQVEGTGWQLLFSRLDCLFAGSRFCFFPFIASKISKIASFLK